MTTFSVNPDKEIHASATGPLEESNTFSITEDGELKKILTVTRQDGRLTIGVSDAPETPIP